MNREEIIVPAAKAMLAIVAIAFVTDLLIILILWLMHSEMRPSIIPLALTEAMLLSLLMAPAIYWIVITPLKREYERRLRMESHAAELGQLAITDALTRTRNRRGITISLLEAMAHAERYGHPLSVAMVDIDHFKNVNDSHGHKAGDRALEGVAGILAETVRVPDKVGRYGGEEFLLVFPETGLEQARKIAERVRTAVGNAAFDIGDKKIKLTVSIGITAFVKSEDLEQLLSRADRALYEAKQAGRDRIVTEPS